MNLKLQNITHLFKNVRTRTIIVLTGLILIFGFLLGFSHLVNKSTPAADSSVQLKETPDIRSVPGGLEKSPSADYQRLQQQDNLQQAARAEQEGTSAIPTLLDTSQFNQSQNSVGKTTCCQSCCCGCGNSQQVAATSSGVALQPSQLRVGTLIYDGKGKVIGRLGADGKVRNKNGEIIGQVGPDGLVRTADGSVIGSAATSAMDDPVYDATGHLIGRVAADGRVRNAEGLVIGTVGPDGIVRDAKGGVIGKVIPPKSSENDFNGAPVYDGQGHLLGTVDADGNVHDAQGHVIGQVSMDGIVRDRQGKIIGKTGVRSVGASVYDAQGRLLGTVSADGKIRDAQGHVVGEIAADGTIHDAEGKAINGANIKSAPVYDAQGHLLGTVGADGEVRDAKGNVIGKLDSDGIVRDIKGNVLGKTGVNSVGASVYDAQGHLLGTVDADGKVRDAQGNILGEVDADGLVRDKAGKIVGRAYLRGKATQTAIIPGSPVYDNQGKLVGTVDDHGQVRDSQGKIIGTLDRDGLLRDADQRVIGKVGATEPGTPLYDQQGRLIGTVGSDGVVRNSQGGAIAHLDSDNVARNVQGNPVGSTVAPVSSHAASTNLNTSLPHASVSLVPNASDNPNPELQAILDRQAQQISAQKAEQLQQQMQTSMATQANQLFVAWTSPTQQYVAGMPEELGSGGRTTIGGSISSGSLTAVPPAVKAGTVMYAVLLTEVNSDEPGPVLAEIVQGKFKGARLLGALSNQGKKVLLSFNTLTLPKLPQSIAVNTVAIDEGTARTALSSYTNNHYWLRYGTLFASAFIQGYGQSFLNASPYAGAIIINPSDKYPSPDLSPRERVFVGLGQVGLQYASALGSVFSTPPTVHVYSGTPMGILFLSDLTVLPNK